MRSTTLSTLDVVGKLHEGVIDDRSWEAGLDSLSDLFGQSGLLLGSMHSGREGFDLRGHRIDPAGVALIAGPMANPIDNPWVAAAPGLPLRSPVTIDDIGGNDVLQRTKLWAGFYLAFGYSQAIGTVLERQPERTDILMLARRENVYVNGELSMFAQLIPHVARAWRVKRQIQELRADTADLTAALDILERGVIITGPDGKIRYANRAADRLLTSGDGIDATNGRVRAARPRETEALANIVRRAAKTGLGQDDVAIDAIPLARRSGSSPLAVVAEPLAPGHHEGLGQGRREGTILFVGDSVGGNVPDATRIAAIYGLTKAEADLTVTIFAGASVAEAARANGVSENTAKTHMKAVYEKIGIARQSQLVRRIMTDIGGLLHRG